MNYILWDDIDGAWRRTPRYVNAEYGRIDSQAWAGQGLWADLAGEQIYEEWISPDSAPLGYNDPVVEEHDGRDKAARYPAGTQAERDARTRSDLSSSMDAKRRQSDQSNVDLVGDPGLRTLIDEANAIYAIENKMLGETPDEDLGSFAPNVDIQDIGAIVIAESLLIQEQRVRSDDPTLTAQQVIDLDASIVEHAAIVQAGDDAVPVPETPPFVRRAIGTVNEDYGWMAARRVFEAGWWWLEFEVRTERELGVNDYWVAVYNDSAPDDRDDTTTGYLTTPKLTDMGDGVYVADRLAVNLPSADTLTGYKYTLCYQHLDSPQFDKIRLAPDDLYDKSRVRWSGNVVTVQQSAARRKR